MGLSSKSKSTTFESGSFTLSADGSTATLGMNGAALAPLNHKVTFDIADATGYAVGQTVTDNTTGATGVITVKSGVTLTLDTLTVGTWANTDTVTNGTNITTVASIPTWIITIPTAKRLKLANIHSVNNATSDDYSIGIDNGISVSYIANQSGIGVYSEIGVVSISVFDNSGTDYCTGLITDIRATEFDITLTQVGVGLAITSQFHLQEQ